VACLTYVGERLEPTAPILLFSVPSVANVISSTAQYESLKYVSFPLQALAKCTKTIPVLLWSLVTRDGAYAPFDYATALTVTLGCALFVLTGDLSSPSLRGPQGGLSGFTAAGLALLALFLVFDGLTSTSQDRLFSTYADMHSCNQLLYTSVWSALLSLGFLAAAGQLIPAIAFVVRHPSALWLILGQSLVSCAVQLFITFTIQQYGALSFALMMTVRQFLAIVMSCLVFGHKLAAMQWWVCGLLFYTYVCMFVKVHGCMGGN
jgi:solute carrier family 35 (adenosine 3'-phospho 5'-phosphosulfate transporter), member B2